MKPYDWEKESGKGYRFLWWLILAGIGANVLIADARHEWWAMGALMVAGVAWLMLRDSSLLIPKED